MGEPGPEEIAVLLGMVKKHFPQCQVIPVEHQGWMVLTVHGQGKTEYDALKTVISDWEGMVARGKCVRTMLDEIHEDLRVPGMTRERHDNLIESLQITEAALNDGILTSVIPWITVPGINREITDLRRRVDARLGVSAADAAAHEKSKSEAKRQSPKDADATTLRIAVKREQWNKLYEGLKKCQTD